MTREPDSHMILEYFLIWKKKRKKKNGVGGNKRKSAFSRGLDK